MRTALALATVLLAIPAAAQTTPRVEVAAGYQVQQIASSFLEKGWFADIAIRATPRISVVVEAAGAHDHQLQTTDSILTRLELEQSLRVHSGSAGLRATLWSESRTRVYLQALGGIARYRNQISMRLTATDFPIEFPGLTGLPPLDFGSRLDFSSLLPDLSSTVERTHAVVRIGAGVTLGMTDRVGLRIALDYGGLVGDQSPPGGPRLMAGLSFGR